MKSRSEALREKREKKSEQKLPPAAARTVPLSFADKGAEYACPECGKTGLATDCTERADGFAECPSCGAPVALGRPGTKDLVADEKIEKQRDEKKHTSPSGVEQLAEERRAKEPPRPPPAFCGECGTELSWVTVGMSTFIYPCGHTKEVHGMVDDPRKAKKAGTSPAPHGIRTQHEIDRRNASGPGPAMISGSRLSIPWGESRFPVDNFNYFKVGGHIITVELNPDEDRVEVAERIITDLEKIADRLFARQKAWYERKLGISSDDSK